MNKITGGKCRKMAECSLRKKRKTERKREKKEKKDIGNLSNRIESLVLKTREEKHEVHEVTRLSVRFFPHCIGKKDKTLVPFTLQTFAFISCRLSSFIVKRKDAGRRERGRGEKGVDSAVFGAMLLVVSRIPHLEREGVVERSERVDVCGGGG